MPDKLNKPVIFVAGPTASGKSELALMLAERFDGVVINADSMQVYKEMRVLTARPDDAEEARAPHRLYGVLSVSDSCSAGRWAELAKAEIEVAIAAGKVPILVGGTGLYFEALIDGIAPTPEIPAKVRNLVRAKMEELGAVEFHRLLAAKDPAMAEKLHSNDRQRLMRAMEVIEATGLSLAKWQHQQSVGPEFENPWLGLVVDIPRDELYARCDKRLDLMLEEGALEEVKVLKKKGFDRNLPAMKALGVPDFMAYLDGDMALDEALLKAKTGTRRYAKRQLTWLRRKMISWNYVKMKEIKRNQEKFFSFISHFLLTGES
jgi:tRNA dimethylallyltransferase